LPLQVEGDRAVERDEAPLNNKLTALRSHMSQVLRHGPVDLEVIDVQARFRGSQAWVAAAEEFEVARLAWDLSTAAAIAPVVSLEVVRSAR